MDHHDFQTVETISALLAGHMPEEAASLQNVGHRQQQQNWNIVIVQAQHGLHLTVLTVFALTDKIMLPLQHGPLFCTVVCPHACPAG